MQIHEIWLETPTMLGWSICCYLQYEVEAYFCSHDQSWPAPM